MTARYLTILATALIGVPVMLSAADSTVIAKVGENEVRAEDIKPFIEKLSLRDQLILSKDAAMLNDFVREIIIQQLVYKEALSKKWEQQPQVAAQLEKIRQQAITQGYLQALSTPPEDYPSQTDLQAAYDALKKNNALQVPKQYRLAQIYVACPKGSDKDTEAKAQAKLDAVVKGIKSGDFAAVAKSQSDDAASAQRGGDLGFLAESQIQPEIKTAAATLAKGGVSDPVRLNDGWHLIKVLEVKEPYTATLDEVKGSLSNELRSQRAQVLGKAYLAKLLQQYPVTLNEIAVSKLVNPKGN
ncbi:MAG: peptidylprolyl isomerase [Chthoniobacterales bacterium]